jgi:hypothetical protein
MLDASYVYLDIYLPTAEAGQLRIGSEARIVVDAYRSLALSIAYPEIPTFYGQFEASKLICMSY